MSAYRNEDGELVVRVLAKTMGFHGGARRRAGTTFEIPTRDLPPKIQICGCCPIGWLSIPTCSDACSPKSSSEEKAVAVALVSSGSAGHRQKKDTFEAVMNAGRGAQSGDPKAEAAAVAASGSTGAKAKKQAFEDARDAGHGPQTPVK